MAGGRGALLTLQPLKTSLVCKFPYLKQPPTCLEWCATFFSLSLPSVYKGQLYFIFYVYFLPSSGHFFFFSLLLEREEGRKEGREREASIGGLPYAPGPRGRTLLDQDLRTELAAPVCAPLGNKLATSRLWDVAPTNQATPARVTGSV